MPQIDSKENAEEPAFVLALMPAMMEATADGILVTDAQGRITNVNTKLAEMWSLSWDQIHQRDIQKFQMSVAQKLKSSAGYLACIAEIEASQGLSQTDPIITGPPAGLVDGSVVNAASSNEAEIE